MTDSTDLALRAFEARPTRAEALADLARHYRERGMNETAAMLARRGLAIPLSDDLLFVETHAREEFRTTLAISGYYSQDPETRRLAAEAAESLALDRSASRPAVEHARNVLFWHAPKLAALAPSWEERQLEFEAPAGWRAMNPSVVRYRDRTLAIVRCVNYWIEPDGSYTFPEGEPAIRTRNFLCELSPLHVARNAVEVDPDLGPVLFGGVLGLEDLRLFVWLDQLRFIAACRQINPQGRVEQVIGRIELDGTVLDMAAIRKPWVGWCEKNWMPIQGTEDMYGELYFVYRTDPLTIVTTSMDKMPTSQPAPWAADNWSGSTPLLPFDGGWLTLVHEPLASPVNGRRLYQHRWVWFDGDLVPARCSRRWLIKLNEEIEYVVGLCRAPIDDDLVVSFGSHDRQAWIGTLDANDVREMLGVGG
jgi:hypothetical protein